MTDQMKLLIVANWFIRENPDPQTLKSLIEILNDDRLRMDLMSFLCKFLTDKSLIRNACDYMSQRNMLNVGRN